MIILSMAPPKGHVVGDLLIVAKFGVYMVHMLHFDGKLINFEFY